jgi:hypothetical protein
MILIRYARVDRRPLDPPPVVLLRMFYVQHPGSDREMERELDYESVIFRTPCFPLAKFITVMFKYLACYVLWIYFQSQWSPHRPNKLLQIFLTKAH